LASLEGASGALQEALHGELVPSILRERNKKNNKGGSFFSNLLLVRVLVNGGGYWKGLQGNEIERRGGGDGEVAQRMDTGFYLAQSSESNLIPGGESYWSRFLAEERGTGNGRSVEPLTSTLNF